MAKITMAMANIIAKQMAAAVYKERIDKARSDLKNQVSEYVFDYVPRDVLELSKQYPSYFKRSSCVSLVSGTVQLYNYECHDYPSWQSGVLSISNIQMERINFLRRKLDKIRQENDSFKTRVEDTIYSLGTYKRIKEMFPEAYAYIPTEKKQENTTAIALPIQELQDIFKQAKTSAE